MDVDPGGATWRKSTYSNGTGGNCVEVADLPSGRAVPNDLVLGDEPRLLVVSGSNMSGKSTLLRATGVAAVMAHSRAVELARRPAPSVYVG